MNVVKTLNSAKANIISYNEAIISTGKLSPVIKADIIRTLTVASSWFAIRTASGWMLGPAKYIGAEGISPEFYSKNRNNKSVLDGTEGEKALKKLGTRQPVSGNHPAVAALNALVGRVNKSPKKTACVYILDDSGEAEADLVQEATPLPPMIAGLIEAITSFAAHMPPEGIAALKRRVASL